MLRVLKHAPSMYCTLCSHFLSLFCQVFNAQALVFNRAAGLLLFYLSLLFIFGFILCNFIVLSSCVAF